MPADIYLPIPGSSGQLAKWTYTGTTPGGGPDGVPSNIPYYTLATTETPAGGSNAVTIVEGGDITEGALADTAVQGDTAGSLSAKLRGLNKAVGTTGDAAVTTDITGGFLGYLRGIVKLLAGTLTTNATVSNFPASQPVSGTFYPATQPVSGTFWQATQPVSAAALPLPTGAATDATLTGGNLLAQATAFNETTADKWRNNTQATLHASAAETTTFTSADLTNFNASFLALVFNVTVIGAATTLTVTIDGKTASGLWYNLLTSAAVATTTANPLVFLVGPGLSATANLVANNVPPRTFRVVVTPSTATSCTYSLDYNLMV